MIDLVAIAESNGLEVLSVSEDVSFGRRKSHLHSMHTQMEGLQRLTRAFVESPDSVLQELVNAALELCNADSAGLSLERDDRTDEQYYEWAATAGDYSEFMDAILPRTPSACGICLERGTPQVFRVRQKFFDVLGVHAPPVTDGLLLPWQVGETRGTIFVMAHARDEAFDMEDCRTMEILADFAAMAVRHQRQRRSIVEQASSAAGVAMANELAHRINNPLQGLTNLVYMAAEGMDERSAQALAQDLSPMLDRLSVLVTNLLALPLGKTRRA